MITKTIYIKNELIILKFANFLFYFFQKVFQKKMSTNIWLLIKLNAIDKYHEGKIYIVTIECNKEFVESDIEYLEVYIIYLCVYIVLICYIFNFILYLI